ncbi:lantibiotic dehydratase [Leuconostoc gasicomitatum]|uniref:lantibiotic dehydratase n=1 Tax=Leuconostoc gasicomitatum TaxID=115778 RepID=UPI0007E1E81F|nr:lantibiotic dehydratase [Leuconostoc gasicomitatum]CUW08465.1 hypothetical protein PB1E_0948 [Leuconostoc gasicomitatum]
MISTNEFMVRNTLCPISKFTHWEDEKIFLQKISDNHVFMEQLFIANTSVYKSLFKYQDGSLDKKREKRLFESIYKFYKRSIFRSTPFGLFSETSIGEFLNNDSHSIRNISGSYKKIILDSEWLISFIFELERISPETLKFKTSNANYTSGDRINQIYTINSSNLENISIADSHAYQLIMASCNNKFISYNDIILKVVKHYGQEFEGLTRKYLNQLIENHFLISELNQDVLENFSLDMFIEKINKLGFTDHYIIFYKLNKLIKKYEQMPIGKGVDILKDITNLMSSLIVKNNYIQIDLATDNHFTLSKHTQKQIEKFGELVKYTVSSVEKTDLDVYKDKFIEKYGINQEVKLTTMLDSTFGIGAPCGYSHPKNDFEENNSNISLYSDDDEKMYLGLYTDALENNEFIDLSAVNTFYSEKNKINNRTLSGLELFFDVYINKDKAASLVLGNTVGTSNLGGSSGRFSHLNAELTDYHKKAVEFRKNDSSNNKCEIVFLPENLRHSNVMHTQIDSEFTLSVFTSTKENNLKINDLYVGIGKQENFYVKDNSSGTIVDFYVTNMYNKNLFSNPIRFLYEITQKNELSKLPWDNIYSKFKHVPRIVFNDIIVSPEKWEINIDGYHNIDENKAKEIIHSAKIPSKFYLADGDNRILIDIKNNLDVLILVSIFNKNRIITIQENYLNKNIEDLKVTDIVVPLINDNINNSKDDIETFSMVRFPTSLHEKLPFDEWVYFKIFVPTNRQNEFISNYLEQIYLELGKVETKLFFLRYLDPVPEIRLRIKPKDKRNLFKTFNVVYKVLNIARENGILNTYDISTYDKEVERYGGIESLLICENIFCFDSELIAKLLKVVKDRHSDLNIDCLSVVSAYIYLKYYFNFDNDVILKFLHAINDGENYRLLSNKKKEYEMLIQNWQSSFIDQFQIEQLTNQIRLLSEFISDHSELKNHQYSMIDSIIHVHNNRLIGINRKREKEIYQILEKIIITEQFKKRQK